MVLQVKEIKTQLMMRREALASELRLMTSQLVNQQVSYTDSIDQTAADIDRNFNLQMKDRDRVLLFQIDEALRKIETGSFGKCEKCEEDISDGRLKAFPFAILCIECKVELESEEHRFLNKI